MQIDLATRVKHAIESGVAARNAYYASIDLVDEQRLGDPTEESALLEVERKFGRQLPPSYREFLTQCNGWAMIDGGVDLFPAQELIGGARFEAVHEWQRSALARGDAVVGRCLVVGGSNVTSTKYLLDPDTQDSTGEWSFIQYHNGVEAEMSSFLQWLEESVDEYRELAELNPDSE
jgi:SMI1 / KNR4 family (SUKH-1)